MLLRWHGHTNFFESLYIIPGGFGNGIALSASFIGLTAGVEPCQVAIASSGLYLSSNIGNVMGLSIGSAVLQTGLRKQLRIGLEGTDNREELIEKALSDLEFVKGLKGKVGQIVTEAYIRCLAYTHGKLVFFCSHILSLLSLVANHLAGVSVIGAVIALLAAICIREHRL
jgi:hypothetical protein